MSVSVPYWLKQLSHERGQADLASWLITQVPFWFLVTLIVVIAMVGVKQVGTASIAHLTARRAGTATLAAGQQVAIVGSSTWRLPGSQAQVRLDPGRRATTVQWSFTWQADSLAGRFLGPFGITVNDHARLEGFYDGPPSSWE
jgi:hypothetical protein